MVLAFLDHLETERGNCVYPRRPTWVVWGRRSVQERFGGALV
jgi:hypothetical protein